MQCRAAHERAVFMAIGITMAIAVGANGFVRAVEDGSKPAAKISDSPWQTVSSKSNAFSVSMPGTVSKAQQSSDKHISTTYLSMLIAGRQKDFYVLTCTKYGDEILKKRMREKLMRETVYREVANHMGKLVKQTKQKLDGQDAIEFSFDGFAPARTHVTAEMARNLIGRGRVIWSGDTEYSLVYATTRSATGGNGDRFLNSFKVNTANN
jgi:hypothetical protein